MLVYQSGKADLLCLDWDDLDPYLMYGQSYQPNSQGIDMIMAPCSYLQKEFDDIGQPMTPECIADTEK